MLRAAVPDALSDFEGAGTSVNSPFSSATGFPAGGFHRLSPGFFSFSSRLAFRA